MSDIIAQLAQTITDKATSNSTGTARGTVTAVSSDGTVSFTIGTFTTPRKGIYLGPGVPQVGDVIVYFDEGSGWPLVLGATGPRNLSIDATKAFVVGNATMTTTGVTVANAWSVVTLTGGWANVAGGFIAAAVRRVGDIVQLRGMVKDGTIGGSGVATAICTLAAAYRPPSPMTFATIAGNSLGRININPDGGVYCEIGSNTFVSLDGINYSTSAS